jgi:hypothetical protein
MRVPDFKNFSSHKNANEARSPINPHRHRRRHRRHRRSRPPLHPPPLPEEYQVLFGCPDYSQTHYFRDVVNNLTVRGSEEQAPPRLSFSTRLFYKEGAGQ